MLWSCLILLASQYLLGMDSSNKTKNKTRIERIPPTRTRIESEVREQGLNCLEQECTTGVDKSEE